MGTMVTFPAAPLTDDERLLVCGLGRRSLGLTPEVACLMEPAKLADAPTATRLLHGATPELFVQVRQTAAKAPRKNCCMLETPLWVARDRRHEYDALGLADDLSRIAHAVHVAEVATATSSVRTKDVTDVLHLIPELQLETVSLTQTMLQQALSNGRVVRGDGDAPGRRRRWHTVGARPKGRAFDDWVARMRPVLVARGAEGSTARGVAERLEEIVTLAVQHFQDTTWWPSGRPVSIGDIERAAVHGERLRALVEALPSQRGLAVALADATRVRPDCPRTAATLVKAESMLGRGALYDVRSLAGQEARALYPVYNELAKAAHSARLDSWRNELREARRLRMRPDASMAVAAVGAVRLVAARHALLSLRERMHAFLHAHSTLSPTARAHLEARLQEVDRITSDLTDESAVRADATALLAEVKAPPVEEVLAAEHEGLVADELTALICEPSQEKLSASEWAGQLKTLPYRENPAFKHRSAPSARTRSERLYDRPSAIVYLASRRNARSVSAIDRAMQWVGRGPLCGALYLAAWRAAHLDERADALLALCLIDGRLATHEARRVCTDVNETGATRAAALIALCIGDALTDSTMERVARDHDPHVQSMLDACRVAQVTGHLIP